MDSSSNVSTAPWPENPPSIWDKKKFKIPKTDKKNKVSKTPKVKKPKEPKQRKKPTKKPDSLKGDGGTNSIDKIKKKKSAGESKPAAKWNHEQEFFKQVAKFVSKKPTQATGTAVVMIPNEKDHSVMFPVGGGLAEADGAEFWKAVNDWRMREVKFYIKIFIFLDGSVGSKRSVK